MSYEQVIWSPGISLEALEKLAIQACLNYNRGNKTATANSLGICVRTLGNKLEKYAEEDKLYEERRRDAKQRALAELARQRGYAPAQNVTPQDWVEFTETQTNRSMESAAKPTEKSEMPVPERSKVQDVLPEQTTTFRKPRGR